jgi:NAD(P)-dependent dehydrogenase (short-subunit alcohol dehydrogenase family)
VDAKLQHGVPPSREVPGAGAHSTALDADRGARSAICPDTDPHAGRPTGVAVRGLARDRQPAYGGTVPPHPFDLTGKVALVTGGNSGLGLAFAEAIARAGGDVVIWGRRDDRNAEAAERLRAHGVRVATDTVDVADEDAQRRGFARALAEMGRLDGVIANAGFVTMSSIVDMSTKQYDDLQRVAQYGAFITLREGARHMVARAEAGDRGGSLVATGSLTNFTGTPGLGHYAAAKCAVAGIVRTLAVELGPHGIRANMVCAGLTKTAMVPFDDAHPLGQMANARIPLGRMAEPDEIAGIVVYLLSDASRYHTGDLITVDGGRSATGV